MIHAFVRRSPVLMAVIAATVFAAMPVSAARPVHDSGTVALQAWHQLDLDTGVRSTCSPAPACGEDYDPPKLGGSDLRLYQDVKSTVLSTVRVDGPAKIVRWGATRPTYAQCRDARQITLAAPVRKVGIWFCARTNSGRIARLRFLGIGTGIGSASSHDFRWTTWVK